MVATRQRHGRSCSLSQQSVDGIRDPTWSKCAV